MDRRGPRAILMLVCLVLVADRSVGRAQEPPKTVAAGVYTDEQAVRGALTYERACSGCHRPDLGGGSGPALTGERFNRDFAGKDVKALFTKISTTMPRGDAGGLGEDVYLDVVAHVLRENGFPAGSRELDAGGLEGVRVLAAKVKPPPPMGDFSYVEVVGCLASGPGNTWILARASDPVVATPPVVAAASSANTARPLGTLTFNLLDAMAYAPDAHKGHKMYVRGLLIKLPGEQRMTISSFEMVSPSCSE